MDSQLSESVPARETDHESLEARQRFFNWKQREEAGQIDDEYLAQQREAEQRAWFIALFNPCGVE